jgi:iron complex outermembrane receptor protein
VGSGTIDIVTGGQLRDFQPDSDGTFLADANDEDISATEVGGYVQLDYRPTDKIRLNTAARVDNHSNYDTQFSPKAALVYTVAPNQNVRVGFNRAFKSPTVLESNLFIAVPGLGNVFRGNIDGYTVRSGPTPDASVANEVNPLDPEEVNSLEVGYKGVFGRRVFVDLVAYNSWYENFISPLTNVANPATGTFAFQDGQLVDGSGFLWTYFNFGEATVRGLDLGVEVQASDHLNLSGSLSLIDLADFEQGDAQQDLLLNVPETKLKGSATVRDLGVEGWFASLSGRWQSAYAFRSGFWDSANFYDDGEVPSRFTASLTAGYSIPETGVSIKASATNLFDTERVDVLGAPQTERLIWVSATYALDGLRY